MLARDLFQFLTANQKWCHIEHHILYILVLCLRLQLKNRIQKSVHNRGYSNLSEWKAPLPPNFQKTLVGSYLSEFQIEGGSNVSEFSK